MIVDHHSCLLCGGDASKRDARQPGYRQGSWFDIFACAECNTAFATPPLVDSELYELIYNNIDVIPGYERYGRYAESVLKTADPLNLLATSEEAYWALDDALQVAATGARILDVGSGLGYLTHALSDAGYDATGLDVSSTAVANATRRYGPLFIQGTLEEYAASHAATFDAVVLIELIEHVPDVTRLVRCALSLLRPQGRVIVTTPNRSLMVPDVLWDTEPPPVHIWWFSEDSLKEVARQSECDISFVDFTRYYREHPTYVHSRVPTQVPTRGHVIDASGLPLVTPTRSSTLRRAIRNLLGTLRLGGLTQGLKGKRRLRGRSGTTLCAVLDSPSEVRLRDE